MQIAVLSPHRDDAAFSCGLMLHSLLRAGCSVTIVNVCTISRYAPYLIGSTGDLTQQVTEVRRKEDVRFVEKLRHAAGAEGCTIELVDLGWQDLPLRWQIESENVLDAVALLPQEVMDLAEVFRALPVFDVVLAPMAFGGHIDHRMVLQAAWDGLSSSSLVFYEDLPYACRMSAAQPVPSGLDSDVPLSEAWLPVQGTTGGLKREYALCYSSQIAADVADQMESYAKEHGGRERFQAGTCAMDKLRTALQLESTGK